jgi:hypothetical protein
MKKYIGPDVHAASTTFAVISEAGTRVGSHGGDQRPGAGRAAQCDPGREVGTCSAGPVVTRCRATGYAPTCGRAGTRGFGHVVARETGSTSWKNGAAADLTSGSSPHCMA